MSAMMIYTHTLPVVLLKPVRLVSKQKIKHVNKSLQDLSQRGCFYWETGQGGRLVVTL